jgi:Flp pilus assembly protein TadG
MRHNPKKHQDSGVAAVELALLIPVVVLLIAGILEFGHAWYVKQAITSASREGARYGIVYRTVTVGGVITRLSPDPNAPLSFNPSIETVVDNYLLQFFEEKFWDKPSITLTTGTGTTIPDAGNNLTVTVTADKKWLLLGGLIGNKDYPRPPDSAGDWVTKMSAETTMKLE